MPSISELFLLGKKQPELDFVNIHPNKDLPLYLNPFVLSIRSDPFSIQASRTVQGFFQHNLELIKNDKVAEARRNFQHLNEPNETCFGQSHGRPRGNGMGEENTDDIFNSILQSKARESGLIDHLENTALFIPGIGRDKVSDMTTNIIRKNLIEYTQSQCDLLGIPMRPQTASGFYWNSARKTWLQEYTRMLVIDGKKILLVPKAIVSFAKEFTSEKYHRHFALDFLQEDHLKRSTTLVQVSYNKDGSIRRRFVTKTDLIEKELPCEKERLVDFTKRHPEVFASFREQTAKKILPIAEVGLEAINMNELVEFLKDKLENTPTGNTAASSYHTLVIGVLELIFYPTLINPIKEKEIHDGRK